MTEQARELKKVKIIQVSTCPRIQLNKKQVALSPNTIGAFKDSIS